MTKKMQKSFASALRVPRADTLLTVYRSPAVFEKFVEVFEDFGIIIEVDCSTSPPAVTRLTVYRGPYITQSTSS